VSKIERAVQSIIWGANTTHALDSLLESDARLRKAYRTYKQEGTDEAWAKYYAHFKRTTSARLSDDVLTLDKAMETIGLHVNDDVIKFAKMGQLGHVLDCTTPQGPHRKLTSSYIPSQKSFIYCGFGWNNYLGKGSSDTKWGGISFPTSGYFFFYYMPDGSEYYGRWESGSSPAAKLYKKIERLIKSAFPGRTSRSFLEMKKYAGCDNT